MTNEADILRYICLYPDDDAPRLAFADWLDENGQPDRAEFIRKSIEKAIYGTRCTQPRPPGIAGCGKCPFCRLEDELMWSNYSDLTSRVEGFITAATTTRHWSMFEPTRDRCVYYWRGFVDAIDCTLAEFMAHAQTIALVHPVRKWVLTDVRPYEALGYYQWYKESLWPQGCDYSDLPIKIFDLLRNVDSSVSYTARFYDDELEAIADLQQACYHYARVPLLASIAAPPRCGLKRTRPR